MYILKIIFKLCFHLHVAQSAQDYIIIMTASYIYYTKNSYCKIAVLCHLYTESDHWVRSFVMYLVVKSTKVCSLIGKCQWPFSQSRKKKKSLLIVWTVICTVVYAAWSSIQLSWQDMKMTSFLPVSDVSIPGTLSAVPDPVLGAFSGTDQLEVLHLALVSEPVADGDWSHENPSVK